MSVDEQAQEASGESYIYDYEGSMTKSIMTRRTVSDSAAFFLPYLRPGNNLLDMGCGQGSITIGLAQAISPGSAIGVDIEESQVRAAEKRAMEQRVSNVTFLVGDIYHLDFDRDRFDVVFSHAVLDHLQRPVDALKEAWRVLKPGGIIGVRAADFEGFLIAPVDPLLEKGKSLQIRFRKHSGGSPLVGRDLRALLREAGFHNTRGFASCMYAGTSEEINARVAPAIESWTGPKIREAALRLGWADASYFEAVERALRKWGESPDSFSAVVHCEAIGWKSSQQIDSGRPGS